VATVAVGGISFAVARGTTAGLLGGNGAGKTTTLSILLGLLPPTAGRAVTDGRVRTNGGQPGPLTRASAKVAMPL
jgi:ABC-type multidrug transport system ATPase subunit